jgi:hypothetical protein
MNTKFIDYKALAKEIEAKVVREFRTDFAEERMGNDDIGYTAMLISDAGDMLNVCRYIGWGDFSKATRVWREMDTLPRENLAWYIEEVAGSDFFDTMIAE